MKLNSLLFIMLMPLCAVASASSVPLLGDMKAESHQICGKNIDIQIRPMNDNSLIIGLMNNKTHTRDLFKSQEPNAIDMKFTKFVPVRFDNLSKTFIEEDKPEIEIVWGSARDDKKAVNFSLALGPQVYECGLIQKWPNDAANLLYGEAKS